ncbi:MAG: 50S ribosome-binding GTPase [Selenomonadaceae bacterium]|nr:50S ribosome-binding GTPase [Selenomonadaceae bacterium]
MFADYRVEDIRRKMQAMEIRPLDVMVTGVTGAGKSTTLNALFGKQVAKVGNGVEPETMDLSYYELNNVARFWDTPGLGDGVAKDKIHEKKIVDLLYKTYYKDDKPYGWIDLVLVIIEGINRDMGSTYKLLNEVIVPNFQRNRILVAVNQADVAMKGRHWDSSYNCPDATLENFLRNQVSSIKGRVREATSVDIITPIYYSGEYGYNVNKLMDLIIDNIPRNRRDLVLH